jgi:2-polyprenyl-6-methoxyphenol hydroxylase-like FAD-dependent oxidoreductase
MGKTLDIAVVGAGITGLASAIMLTRLGHRVVVYERFQTPRLVGSGLMLQPTGLAALERLGLRQPLDALGHRIDRLHGVTAKGATIFDLAYGDLDRSVYALAVHRGALQGVLWSGFERSGARLEAGCEIAAAEPRADSRTSLVGANGRVHAAADLIIDASGARSPLRSSVCTGKARSFTYGAVWATVPDIGAAPNALAQRYADASVMVGYLPLGRLAADGPPLAAFFWSLKTGEHETWRVGFAAWRERVAALWPAMQPVLAGFAGPDDLTLASYMQFTAERLSRGNLVLAGDAAHSTSPQLGQGANQGLIDAVVLADAIADSTDLAVGLRRYERRRRRHVRFYQYASALMTPFFQSDSRLLARLRDLTFHRMKIVPYLHREMVRTLAGLKTGLFHSATPAEIVNGPAGAGRGQP